jgi:hypothetical protein
VPALVIATTGIAVEGGEPMKLRDLFLPKIARSDPEARIEAVKSEANVALLKKVVENDSDARVKSMARKRIEELREPVS